jgi:hypothetical protein
MTAMIVIVVKLLLGLCLNTKRYLWALDSFVSIQGTLNQQLIAWSLAWGAYHLWQTPDEDFGHLHGDSCWLLEPVLWLASRTRHVLPTEGLPLFRATLEDTGEAMFTWHLLRGAGNLGSGTSACLRAWDARGVDLWQSKASGFLGSMTPGKS